MVGISVHKATPKDSAALFVLNEELNGVGCTSLELVEASLANNTQELVFIATLQGVPAGFCCVQLYKSMCYDRNYAEVTEFFIDEKYRRQGVGTKLMKQMEQYFAREDLAGFQLLTGDDNWPARSFYESLAYKKTGEIMYRKRRTQTHDGGTTIAD